MLRAHDRVETQETSVTAAVRRRVVLAASLVFSELVVLLLLRMPDVPGEGSWLQAFRGYFSYDQLSYAGIASTTAAGVSGLPEPFTETGQSYYPSLWYRIIGWVASLTGASVPAVWTVAGLLVLGASVALVGWVAYRVSGLAWGPALVGPALAIGTMSVVLHDNWYTPLESHAVLWGPFGALYALNAEVAGFACVGAALALILRSAVGPALRPRTRIALLSVAAILLGVTANLQTYTFFVGAGVAFSWLGAYGLLRSRSRALLIVTAVLVAGVILLGSTIAGVVGALPTYALFLACTLPGIAWIAWRHLRVIVVPALLFVAAAAPQAAIVASGVLAKDEFLTYRQDASALLGVPLWAAVLASLPVIAIWLFNVAVVRTTANTVVAAALGGLAFSGVMLTFNGVWGFGQEPYRMWIDSITVSLLLLAPLTAWSIARLLRQPTAERSRLAPVAAGLAIAVVGLSLLDVGLFRTYIRESGVISFDSARNVALGTVTADVDGLMTGGPCVDPQDPEDRLPQAGGVLQPRNRVAGEPGRHRRRRRAHGTAAPTTRTRCAQPTSGTS